MSDNPNCAETYATLRIMGRNVDPEALTRTLGIVPTFQARIGERIPERSSPRSEGMWSISTKHLVHSTDLEVHITSLLDMLKIDFGQSLPPDCYCDMFCLWRSASGHGGPSLSATTLSRLGEHGIVLDFDIYFEDGDIKVFIDDEL